MRLGGGGRLMTHLLLRRTTTIKGPSSLSSCSSSRRLFHLVHQPGRRPAEVNGQPEEEGLALTLTTRKNFSTSAPGTTSYLPESYPCDSQWAGRLTSPLLQKLDLDDFFQQVDQKFQSEDKYISAIDVDLYANKVSDPESLDELEELTYRLRKSPATSNTLPSTGYAVIRAFLSSGKTDELMRILNDRMNYGVFVETHSANLLMNHFIKEGNYRDAAKIATLQMLEEDFSSPTTKYFSLLSCLKYLENPGTEPWDPDPQPEETPPSKEETRVRVRQQRNPYYDDHFDLSEPELLLGKTLALLSFHLNEDPVLQNSIGLLGWAMYQKWNQVQELLVTLPRDVSGISKDVVNKVKELASTALTQMQASPDKTLPTPKMKPVPGLNLDPKEVAQAFTKLHWDDFSKPLPKVNNLLLTSESDPQLKTIDFPLIPKTELLLQQAIQDHGSSEVNSITQAFKEWESLRSEELDRQIRRAQGVETLLEIRRTKKDLAEREETIFFFDNEEQWMMRQPPAVKIIRTRWKGKYRPPKRKADETYIPPEV